MQHVVETAQTLQIQSYEIIFLHFMEQFEFQFNWAVIFTDCSILYQK